MLHLGLQLLLTLVVALFSVRNKTYMRMSGRISVISVVVFQFQLKFWITSVTLGRVIRCNVSAVITVLRCDWSVWRLQLFVQLSDAGMQRNQLLLLSDHNSKRTCSTTSPRHSRPLPGSCYVRSRLVVPCVPGRHHESAVPAENVQQYCSFSRRPPSTITVFTTS